MIECFSKTTTSCPALEKQIAAVRPPSLAPTMAIFILSYTFQDTCVNVWIVKQENKRVREIQSLIAFLVHWAASVHHREPFVA